ncbi:MAG: DUF433 domain-containing protein, partial [Methanotrichaceae archaeon]
AVFATHYHQLTQLEETLPGVKNYSVAVKEDRGSITFIRTVVPGATDKSYGVHVARLAVEFILDLLAGGWSEAEILQNYPRLTHEDIQACLSYASALVSTANPALL